MIWYISVFSCPVYITVSWNHAIFTQGYTDKMLSHTYSGLLTMTFVGFTPIIALKYGYFLFLFFFKLFHRQTKILVRRERWACWHGRHPASVCFWPWSCKFPCCVFNLLLHLDVLRHQTEEVLRGWIFRITCYRYPVHACFLQELRPNPDLVFDILIFLWKRLKHIMQSHYLEIQDSVNDQQKLQCYDKVCFLQEILLKKPSLYVKEVN